MAQAAHRKHPVTARVSQALPARTTGDARVALDIAVEDRADFEPITRLAAQLCAAPIALLSLLDDRQVWFAARHGVTVDRIPAEHSFCRHIVTHRSPLFVHDTATDPRFAGHPLVRQSPFARACVGVAVMTADERCIGALCVLDTVPRDFEDTHRAALQDLAAMTAQLMDQKSRSHRVEARQAMLDSLLEALPEGVVACDADGHLNLFNSKARKWHESDPMQIAPEDWAQYFHLFEADGQTQLDIDRVPLIRAFAGEAVRDAQICVKSRSQPPRWVTCNGRAFFNASGRRLGAVVAMHDVTESRRQEQEIADVRRHLEAVINASTEVGIIAVDGNGLITLFNSGAENLLGYTREDVVGHDSPSLFYTQEELEAHAAEVSAEYGMPLTGFDALVARPARGQNEIGDWIFVRKDGQRRHVRLVVSAIRDHDSEIIGYLGVAIDRSQIEAAQAALRVSEAQFKTAFDTAAQGMALISLDGNFLEVNRSICDSLGYTRQDLVNTPFKRLVHVDDHSIDLLQISQLMSGTISHYQMVKRFIRFDREVMWGQASVSLVRDDRSRPLYFVVQVEDITQQRELDRIKNEFVAVVSHELRTPLSSIKGALGLLTAGALGAPPAAMQEMLGLAHRNAERLGWLVDDLLDFEKLAADRLVFDIENHSLADLVADALASNRAYAESLGIRLVSVGCARATLCVDSLRFAQVLANLLSNAIKFSPTDGTVTLRFTAGQTQARIEVQDQGAGIPEAFRPRVFEHFAQAESGNTRRQGGTGLGLAISKQMVERMGGQIGFESVCAAGSGFESRPVSGTLFWVELPLADVDTGHPAPPH